MERFRTTFLFFALLSLCLVFSAPAAAQTAPASSGNYSAPTADRPALVRIDLVPDPVVLRALQLLDLDIAYVGRGGEGIEVVVDAADLDLLRATGIPFTMLHVDIIAFYQSRFEEPQSRGLNSGSMGGNLTFSEVEAQLDQFRQLYPQLITAKTSIGTSREGRPIWAVKISDNPDVNENEPEAIIDCLTHAREPQGMMSTLYFVDWVLTNYGTDPIATFLVDEREMWVVPVHNPDGYVYNETISPSGGGMWRKNRRNNGGGRYGVDLNRNWGYKWGYNNAGSSGNPSSETYRGPSSMSEPETQAMANFIINRGAVERMSIHCYGAYWLIPWSYAKILTSDDQLFRDISVEMAPKTYTVGTAWELLYVCNGVSMDWDYGDAGIMTFSPEMGNSGDGFWPQSARIIPIAKSNLRSLQYFFGIAGPYPVWNEITVTEITGNGNGYPEPGETVSIVAEIDNRGLADCQTTMSLTLTSSNPNVNFVSATCQLPALASRASASNVSQPFVMEILPSAAHGEIPTLELEVLFDNARIVLSQDVVLGVPRRLIFDDMETSRGWIAGLPSDTATSGLWERVNPNGTWLLGEPIQPENDNTPGGTKCFVTGNASPGADPGDNDVDDGKTTLVSPLFDLTGGIGTRIGFSRWYANEAGRIADDFFVVEISNDGGSTWAPLDSVFGRGYNSWQEVALDVDQFTTPTDRMRVRFVAEDAGPIYPNHSIVEAAIDNFWVESYSALPILSLFGQLTLGGDFTINVAWDPNATYAVFASLSKGGGVPLPGGTWYLLNPIPMASGTIPADGLGVKTATVPNLPSLVGMTAYFQCGAEPAGGGTAMIGNLTSGVIQN